MNSVTIIDYGIGNILSVCRALDFVGADVVLTNDPKALLNARRIILPGVGAFPDGMSKLKNLGLDDVIQEIGCRGMPLLGICLGMQMLLDHGEEFESTPGLKIISGKVIPIPNKSTDNKPIKIPHVGWNDLIQTEHQVGRHPLLRGVKLGCDYYFTHSFMAQLDQDENCDAYFQYGGHIIPAIISHENTIGIQFHPEKSGKVGLEILDKFVKP